MPVSFSDLQLAFEFVSSGGMGENEAYLDRQSGKIYWHSEFGDNDEELPNDIDDEKCISIPDKTELDLGKPLVLDFAREFLPVDYDEVRHIFNQSCWSYVEKHSLLEASLFFENCLRKINFYRKEKILHYQTITKYNLR